MKHYADSFQCKGSRRPTSLLQLELLHSPEEGRTQAYTFFKQNLVFSKKWQAEAEMCLQL